MLKAGSSDPEVKCPQCNCIANSTTKRLICDSCGHVKCRSCLLSEETGCKTCLRNAEEQEKVAEGAGKTDVENSGNKAIFNNSININEENVEKELKADHAGVSKKRRKLLALKHIIILNSDPPQYQCKDCLKTFKTRAHIKYHEFCGSGEKPYRCDVCDQGFISKSHYEYHQRTHTGERPHKCDVCQKGFSQKAKLRRHMQTHSVERKYVCEVCNQRFTNPDYLQAHKVVHKMDFPHKCNVCQKTFKTIPYLKKHVATHRGERHFMCEDCGKNFSVKWSLDLHRLAHKGSRPHRCTKCPRSFTAKKDLMRHQSVHSELRPFTCEICSTAFRRKDNLERHVRHTHLEGLQETSNGAHLAKKTKTAPDTMAVQKSVIRCPDDIRLGNTSMHTACEHTKTSTPVKCMKNDTSKTSEAEQCKVLSIKPEGVVNALAAAYSDHQVAEMPEADTNSTSVREKVLSDSARPTHVIIEPRKHRPLS